MAAFLLLLVCFAIIIVLSLIWPHQHTDASIKLVWAHPLDALKDKGWRGIGNYKFLSLLLLVTMVALYWAYSKPEYKAPDATEATHAGLQVNYYETEAREFYDLLRIPADIEPSFTGTVEMLDLPRRLEAGEVAEFSGYLKAPRKGFYEFIVHSRHKVDMRFAEIRTSFLNTGTTEDGLATLISQIHLEQGLHSFHFVVYGNAALVESADMADAGEIRIGVSFPEDRDGEVLKLTPDWFFHKAND